jgi:hypothetical protein
MRQRLPVLLLFGALLFGTAGALAQAEAERRLDAAIERLRTALGPDARITIGARRVDPVTGRATLTDVAIIRPDERIAIPELILADLGETRIGRAELLRAREESGGVATEVSRILLANLTLPAPGTPMTLAGFAVEAAELESLRLAAPEGKLVVERLALRDWRGPALGAGTLEGLDWRTPGGGDAFRLRRIALDAVTLPLAGTEFDPAAFRAGRIAMEGIAAREAAQDIAVTLGRIELSDWIPGRPTTLVAADLRAGGPAPQLGAVEIGLDRIEASGVDAAATLAAVLADRQIPDPFPGMPQRVAIEGLRGTAEGQPLLTLRRLVSEGRLDAGIASGSLVTDGFRLTLPRGQAAMLEALGYREIAGGIEIRGSVPRAGGRLDLDPVRVAWEQAATLTLATQLDGMPPVPEPGAELDPDATAAQLAAAQLGGLTLTLRDHGLLGRVLTQQAREQRIPEARLREQWAQMALAMPIPGEPPRRGAPPAAGKDADPFAPMRQAIAAFIRQPGTLEITLRPPKPLPFSELAGMAGEGPARSVERLGLSVVAR